MTANSVAPSYEEVVQRYNLTLLMAGSDLSLTNGDLTRPRTGVPNSETSPIAACIDCPNVEVQRTPSSLPV